MNRKQENCIVKGLVIAVIIVLGFAILPAKAAAAATGDSIVTTFRSSDSGEAYYTVLIDQSRIVFEGRTTESVKEFQYALYKITGNTGQGVAVTGIVTNGRYKETLELPTKSGVPEDGTYQLLIRLRDAKCSPYIKIEDGVAAFYRSDSYNNDLTADAFMKLLDRNDLLESNSVNPFTASPSDLSMNDTQREVLHQLALSITEGISPDYDKAKAVYQWVTQNIYYDDAAAKSLSGNGDNNPYSVYKNRYAVCEGYARLTIELLRSLKIPCVEINGAAQASEITNNSGGSHAWIAVYADQRWFYADPTWDTKNHYKNKSFETGLANLNYFDVTLEALAMTHRVEDVEAGAEAGGFYVTFYRGQVSVETYTGDQSEITLPKNIKGITITQVSSNFIDNINKKVIGIMVPDGYKSIYKSAFQRYTGLQYIVLPDTLDNLGAKLFQPTMKNLVIYCKDNDLVSRYAGKYSIRLSKDIPFFLEGGAVKYNIEEADNPSMDKTSYTGKELKPSLTLDFQGKRLREGIDYLLTYKKNIKPGTGIAVVQGMGNFTGTKEVKFVIAPKKTSLDVTFKEGYLFKWKASTGASGYELYCSKKQYRDYSAISSTLKNFYNIPELKPGYTYYFKVRPYITVNGKRVYGDYSNIMMIRLSYRDI